MQQCVGGTQTLPHMMQDTQQQSGCNPQTTGRSEQGGGVHIFHQLLLQQPTSQHNWMPFLACIQPEQKEQPVLPASQLLPQLPV
jgi:hypothetical protein